MPRRPAKRRRRAEIDALMRSIGGRIAAARKRRGLTQKELAEKVGVTQALLSAYEVGRARLGADVLAKVAETLRVSSDEILGLKPARGDGPYPARRLLRRLARFNDLPRRSQDAVLRMIEGLAEMQGKG